MRRILVLALALAAIAASPAGASQTQRIACGVKTLDFYFWPRGHVAVPELGFPEFRTPHLEVYTGAPVGKLGQQLAYVSETEFKLVQGCPEKGNTPTTWSGGPMKTRRRATSKLHCAYPKRVELLVASLGNGMRLEVTLGHTAATATVATLDVKGARLDYDARYCRVVAGV